MNMDIPCRKYQMVPIGIRSDKQSNPQSIVIPEVSHNPQSTKGIRFAIPEQPVFVHRYKGGYPVVPYPSRLR